MKIKAVLSDAEGILFKKQPNDNAEKGAINKILMGKRIRHSADETYKLFKHFRILGQTKIPEHQAINMFFAYSGIKAGYNDYSRIIAQNQTTKNKLFNNITETLEEIRKKGIPFYMLTNSSKKGKEIHPDLEKRIIAQLKERKCYNPSRFNPKDYITGIVSSKDIGHKKPDSRFFHYCLDNEKIKPDEALIVSRKSEDIFCAADFGLNVAALNYWDEPDFFETLMRIGTHNLKNYIETRKIHSAISFSSIINLLDENQKD